MKISELAKKLKIPSKVLLMQVIKMGITAKSAQAILPQASVDRILKEYNKAKLSVDVEAIGTRPSSAQKSRAKSVKKPAAGKKPVSAKTIKASGISGAKKADGTKPKKKSAKPDEKPVRPVRKKAQDSRQPSVGPTVSTPEEVVSADKLHETQKQKLPEPGPAAVRVAETKQAADAIKKPKQGADEGLKPIQVKLPITVKALADKLSVSAPAVIKELMGMKIFANINQLIDEECAASVARKFGYFLERAFNVEEEAVAFHESLAQDKGSLILRPPVVTFMGHVDHGKTSLLDYIRKTKVTDSETGGITQHIGAYEVILNRGKITFLDTPGHAAFTAMRARGANATDIVVLVVAADDGLMPQTIEAIDHAKAAGATIIVAINKIDKPDIDIDRVKKQLSEIGLLPEDWGGKTITVNVSALTGKGVDALLEMILLEAEMLELKANPAKPAKGVVVEAKISKGGGPIATVLVQNGTLKQGDIIVAGIYYGKIRAILDDKIHRIKDALPSKPAEILGLNGVPQAGDVFMAVSDEKQAKQICAIRQEKFKEQSRCVVQRITLEDLYSQMQKGRVKELKVILKADVRGSLEAISESLTDLGTKNMGLNIIHKGIGDINDSDILLAAASDAIVIGFHVRKTPEAERAGKQEHIDIRLYNIIYEAISDIKSAMEGLLEPDIKEIFTARILVMQVMKLSKAGIIAGSSVQKGKVLRNVRCRLIRDNQIIYKGRISSLKRFKDDVREVAEGFECGVKLENFNDIKDGDIIECFEIEKIARRL